MSTIFTSTSFEVLAAVWLKIKFFWDVKLLDWLGTDMRRLTTGIRSDKFVVRRFRRCANVYLHKPRQYITAHYTPRLYGIV